MKIKVGKKIKFILTSIFVMLSISCAPSNSVETPSDIPTTSEQPSISEPSTPVESINLEAPVLSLNKENGLVTWNSVNKAEFYSYYINDKEIKNTTVTSLELTSGSTLSVRAESSNSKVKASKWSDPITYFKDEIITEYVTIYFHNCTLEPVVIEKNTTYTPQTPTKDYHEFKGWFLDPYFKTELKSDYLFTKNTILYANFIGNNTLNDTYYWIKANSLVNAPDSIASTSWKLIPLAYDEEESKSVSKKIYSTIVTVSGTSSNSYGEYIATDGIIHNDGRSYWKNGEANFTLKTDGTYKIRFSVEHTWEHGGNQVACSAIQISTSYNNVLENASTIPEYLLTQSTQLSSVQLTLHPYKDLVSWTPVENATAYEYSIDNGEISSTTSNNITLYKGQFITVRAITTNSGFLPSRWSNPVKQLVPSYPKEIYVYFYGSDKPNEVIEYNTCIDRPYTNPTKSGYVFDNWYEDIAHTKLFDFSKKLTKNTIIYAKFNQNNSVKFSLYSSNKTTKLVDFEMSSQKKYLEWKATYTVSNDLTTYVKNIETGEFYGPYTMSQNGNYKMYFSEDHKWDYDTVNERNAYWEEATNTYYFSNGLFWSSVYYYTWDANGNYKKGWPGEVMTYKQTNDYGQDIYEVTINTKYTKIIFNNNSGSQTIDIDLTKYPSGTGFYPDKLENGKYTVGTYTL